MPSRPYMACWLFWIYFPLLVKTWPWMDDGLCCRGWMSSWLWQCVPLLSSCRIGWPPIFSFHEGQSGCLPWHCGFLAQVCFTSSYKLFLFLLYYFAMLQTGVKFEFRSWQHVYSYRVMVDVLGSALSGMYLHIQ
jgi:hypothetical protein